MRSSLSRSFDLMSRSSDQLPSSASMSSSFKTRSASNSGDLPPVPLGPVRQALIPAAACITTPDSFANPRQLIRVSSVPVIIHLLHSLKSAGIERTVVTLGHAADQIAEEVRKHSFGKMMVEFVWCETLAWKRGHASNILAARSMFPKLDEPFLLVMSDHIFDQQLLHRLAHCQLAPGDALVLVDDSRTMVEWASPGGAHCQAHCKNGHCGAIVKVTKGAGDRVSLIAKKLTGFDAIDAGAYVVRPRELFNALKQLLTESIYCTLCEALNLMASQGRLRYATVDELDWFGSQTVASLPTPIYSSAVDPAWRQLALEMLRTTSPHLKALPALPTPGPEDAADASAASSPSTALSPLIHGSFGRRLDLGGRGSSGDLSSDGVSSPELSMPLYELGSTIGSGGTSIVVQGRAGRSTGGPLGNQSPATSRRVQRGLAVKVIHKGAAEALGDVEHSVMWEVHVLQQLHHQNIVRVMDVIEVVDATYIIMERVDGPELTEYLLSFPECRLALDKARVIFCHVLSALRHAHRNGFLHCDVKPDNVRLNKACDHAVLTDWGYARTPGMRPETYMCGTPAYASPEQLTGYSPDSVTGRRMLCAATDVWSLGVTFFVMVCGHLPFYSDDHETLVRLVLSTRYQVADCVCREDAELIQSMLQLAPQDRASIDELCALPFLVATNALEPPESPRSPRLGPLGMSPIGSWSLEGRVEMGVAGVQCAECVDGPEDTSVAWHERRPLLRKALWMLLYSSLCAMAVWAHLSAENHVTIQYEAEAAL